MKRRMGDVLPVIKLLRTFDVEQLEALIVQRRIVARASSGIVDVAEWLVDPTHVIEAAERLGWRTVRRILSGDAAALERAMHLAFAVPASSLHPDDADASAEPVLLEVVERSFRAVLERATPIADAPAGAPSDASRDARGAERAHALAALVADLIVDLDVSARAARDGRGGPRLAGVEVRRIATAIELSPEFVESVADAMYRAGLAGPADETWAPTELGRRLERGPRIDRWRAMTEAYLDSLGVDEREAVLGTVSNDAAEPARGVDAIEAATQLGLTVDGSLTTAGALTFDDRVDEAAEFLAGQLPAEVDRVYVQPDLSVIAPGPLESDAEARLRSVADLERRGTASTYRLSAASIARGFESGLDEPAIIDLLSTLSIVPLPQPVTYLVAETSARHGLVRVRPFGSGTRILSTERAVLDGLEVDQALGALRLRRRPDGSLDSLLTPAHVASALAEAKVPATLEREDGTPVGPRAPRTAGPPTIVVSATARRFAANLRNDAERHADGDEESAWLQQRLERARRAKATVRIRVRIDDAQPADLTVVPASMTSRWLRVIDPDADVERTFPLGAIELLDDE